MPLNQAEGSEASDSGAEGFETFGDIEGIGETSNDDSMDISFGDDWSQPIEAPKSSSKKTPDQVKNLDVEEGEITDEGTEIEEKEVDEEAELEEKETKEEEKESAAEEIEEIKPVGKLHKVKIGDREEVIDDGAVLKVKVDGKMQDVAVKDLISNFSGKQNYDKKFKEIAEEKKTFQSKVKQVQDYETKLKTEFGKITQLAKDAVEGKVNPLESIKYLLDVVGEDSFVYSKKAMESLFDEFVQLYDMDEAQQKAYWTAKENEHLKSKSQKVQQSQQREQENQKLITQVEAAQNEFGVDWDGFTDALDYLLSLKDENGKQIYQEKDLMSKPRAVAQYAARKPYITKAQELVTSYEENLGDDDFLKITEEVTNILHESKGAAEKDVVEWLEANYGVSPAVKALNQKLKANGGSSKPKKDDKSKYVVKPKTEDEIEDFEDFI